MKSWTKTNNVLRFNEKSPFETILESFPKYEHKPNVEDLSPNWIEITTKDITH